MIRAKKVFKMSRDDDFSQIDLVDILSTVVSMYGFLQVSLTDTRWSLFFSVPPITQIGVGIVLFLFGWGVLVIRHCFSDRKIRRKHIFIGV